MAKCAHGVLSACQSTAFFIRFAPAEPIPPSDTYKTKINLQPVNSSAGARLVASKSSREPRDCDTSAPSDPQSCSTRRENLAFDRSLMVPKIPGKAIVLFSGFDACQNRENSTYSSPEDSGRGGLRVKTTSRANQVTCGSNP